MGVIKLQGTRISLRALEPRDIELLFAIENDPSGWEISNTQAPYSKFLLNKYLDNSHQDLYEAKQLRLVITSNELDTAVGFIDLFDFDPQHRRVGVGILLLEDSRGNGYGADALRTLCEYVFQAYGVHQLFANITSDNMASINLFKNQGFVLVGNKKDWLVSEGTFKDELLFQYIKE